MAVKLAEGQFSRLYRSGTILGGGFEVLSAKKTKYFRQLFESRIAELERVLLATEREVRASGAKHADPADQAASEYERQSLAHKAASARQTLKALKESLRALQEGRFGECAECGGDMKRFGRGTASSAKKQGSSGEA